MAESGFEYAVTVPADVLLEEARANAVELGRDAEHAIDEVDLPDNPNDAIVAGLSEAELRAYELAYWGPNDVDGCYYNTYEEAWGVDILQLADRLDSQLADAEQRIAVDPRVVDAKRDLLSCIRADGYEVSNIDDLYRYPELLEAEAVQAILRSGADEVLIDDPLWVEFLVEIDKYESTFGSCEALYLAIIQPIENEYLTTHDP